MPEKLSNRKYVDYPYAPKLMTIDYSNPLYLGSIQSVMTFKELHINNGVVILEIGASNLSLDVRSILSHYDLKRVNAGSHSDYDNLESVPEEFFDVVMSINYLQDIPLFWKVLHDMVNKCKELGLIYIVVPGIGSPASGSKQAEFFRFSKELGKHFAEYMSVDLLQSECNESDLLKTVTMIFRKPKFNTHEIGL